ncbi:hypothetical protein PoB_005737200 [Plakobranchus ocellatus]|uniref:Uncharacterized protein n=1 Tax=Plakobranchus ocellatus TaxID=259542 RepID=A0AAV4CH11_9GAST|nr:hypothetical protein PoB_005737200 [Plakobranchus ocellatus]
MRAGRGSTRGHSWYAPGYFVGSPWHSGYRVRPEVCRDPSVAGSTPLPAPWPGGGPKSLRSPCCGLDIVKNQNHLRYLRVAGPSQISQWRSMQISGRVRTTLRHQSLRADLNNLNKLALA